MMTQQPYTPPTSQKLVIRVAPDTAAPAPLPQVIVSKWDVEAAPGQIIEWQAVKDCSNFKLTEFLKGSTAFKNVVITDDVITCEFDPDPGNDVHEYDIGIEKDGSSYDTQPQGGPDPGRPVIRN